MGSLFKGAALYRTFSEDALNASELAPQLSLGAEKRAESVERKLAQWTRKLRLAQTKVHLYKRRKHYYDHKLASTALSLPEADPR